MNTKQDYPKFYFVSQEVPLDDKIVSIGFWGRPKSAICGFKCTLRPREMTKRELLARLIFRLLHGL